VRVRDLDPKFANETQLYAGMYCNPRAITGEYNIEAKRFHMSDTPEIQVLEYQNVAAAFCVR
jgi:hypothetical protein